MTELIQYAVDDEQLKRFDEYEDEGDLYTRKIVKVELSDKRIIDAQFYEYNKDTINLELWEPEGKWNLTRKPYKKTV